MLSHMGISPQRNGGCVLLSRHAGIAIDRAE
ncbi:MAG: hypothetical protein QOF51_1774, partial [Chloroflexota bacterium]|nr:hypothetical protein [Chloroflexota bacterium]